MPRLFALSVTFLTLQCFTWLHAETRYFNGKDFKAGFYIVPDELPEEGEKMWVVVDVHGAGGLKNERGSGLIQAFAPTPVIAIIPSFTTGYQGGDGKWAEQMIENFEEVQKQYPVHDKMFIHGFSGGAQFAHRFAMAEPDHVIGVSAHSAGSWACDGGYGTISSRAKSIPFLISCGADDTSYSVQGYPFTRVEWYQKFAEHLENKGFVMAGGIWPGVGHNGGAAGKHFEPLLKECFFLATQGIEPSSGQWKGDIAAIAREKQKSLGKATVNPDSSGSNAAMEKVRAANQAIKAGRKPDLATTLQFLARYPASTWAAEEEFAFLKEHCQSIAQSYLQQRSQSGSPLTGATLEKFKKATEGLGLEIQ